MSSPQPPTTLTTLAPELLNQICTIFRHLIDQTPKPDHFLRCPGPSRPRKPIYDLLALSCTNKYMRELCSPFLFSNIAISEVKNKKGNWEDGVERLERLNSVGCLDGSNEKQNENGILGLVKTFEFTIVASYSPLPATYRPPPNAHHYLATTLSLLTNLQTLTLNLPSLAESKHSLEIRTCHPNIQFLTLSNVKTLILSPACHILIGMCPNAENIYITPVSWSNRKDRDRAQCFEAVSAAENVVEVNFARRWSLAMAKALASKPSRSLRKLGEIRPDEDERILELVKVLSPLRNLEELHIASVSDLDMDYEAPFCGNAYNGPSGQRLMKSLAKERAVIEGVVLGAIDGCIAEWRALKKVVIGGEYASFEKRDVEIGEVEGKWRVGRWVRDVRSEDHDGDEPVREEPSSSSESESEPEDEAGARTRVVVPVLDSALPGNSGGVESDSDSDSSSDYDWLGRKIARNEVVRTE